MSDSDLARVREHENLADWPPQQLIRLPMIAGNRSLNLSNAVAIVVFEAWRQLNFVGSS